MKIEKDGIIKELSDEFMLADYMLAGWKEYKAPEFTEIKVKPFKKLKLDKENK